MCVSHIDRWLTENFLKNNADKLEAILFGTWQQRSYFELDSIELLDTMVAISDKVKNLGVHLDADMSMKQQVAHASKSANYHLRNIRMIRRYLPVHAVKSAVHAAVTSRLDMSNSLLAGICKCRLLKGSVQCQCSIQQLQYVQNSAARVIQNLSKKSSVTPVLRELHWLPVCQRIEFKLLTLVFKCIHGDAPAYLKELIVIATQRRSLRSASNGTLLRVPKTKLATAGDRMFSSLGPKLWNALPYSIRSCTSLASFKKHLKTHLFSKAYCT